MMKRKLVTLVLLTLLCTCAIFSLFNFADNATWQFTEVTQLNYNQNSDYFPITVSKFKSLSDRISTDKISFCCELEKAKIKDISVTPVLTNEYFFENYGFSLSGSGITEQYIEDKERVAVIDSNLALELFFNTNAVGKMIEINGKAYTVCSVIDFKNSYINRISADSKRRIYFPYTCYDGYESCDIDTITYDNSAISAPLIEQMNLSQYYATDFSEKHKVIENIGHITLLSLFAVLCFVTIKVWFILCKWAINGIKYSLREQYFFKSLTSILKKYIVLIIAGAGVPALLLTVFFLSDFSIYIPSQYIPYDNVFDFSYYLEKLIENGNTINSLALTGDTHLIKLYSNTFAILIPHIVAIIILLVCVTVYVNNAFINHLKAFLE
ncbi:MAG: ABC transporter permease [Acutalibacteraceae bacterium]